MSEPEPLISCLCITYKKEHLLPRAIDCFRNQTYHNKELLVLYQDDDRDTALFLKSIKDDNIFCYEIDSKLSLTLGAKRNLSVAKSTGAYFCNWDDDDWYHNERLKIQMAAIQENFKEASILMYIILYDAINHQAYLSFPWTWEGTILCKRSLFEKFHYHSTLNKGEDSHFLLGLLEDNCIYPVIKPPLYIYIYHGKNTWDFQHFNSFFSQSQKLSESSTKLIKNVLEGSIDSKEISHPLFNEALLKEVDYLRGAKKTLDALLKRKNAS